MDVICDWLHWTNTTLTECYSDDEGSGLSDAKAGAGQDGGAAVQGPKPGATAGKWSLSGRQPNCLFGRVMNRQFGAS